MGWAFGSRRKEAWLTVAATEHLGVTLADIEQAAERIAGVAQRTPLKPAWALGREMGRAVYLKLETMQPTGAFKLRGAANLILSLTPDERERGLVTCSSGNHGRAVAYVARQLGLRAVVFLSALAPANKVAAIRDLGAEVIICPDYDAADAASLEYARARRMTYVHPFDDPRIVAGQGTIGLEIVQTLPEVATLVVPVSGGGLIAGVALAAKALKPGVRVIGVSMEHGAAMHASVHAGRPVPVVEEATLADALAGGIGPDNRLTLRAVQQLVDDILLVSEEQIADAMAYALLEERLVLEGAAACPIALLRDPRAADYAAPLVAVCSGDNVDMGRLLAIARRSSVYGC
jgi:threonine dehydratase